jgi:hypothetical protein
MRLSTLSRRDIIPGAKPSPSVAPIGPVDSSEVGRSYLRWSTLPGVAGETIDATLMLLTDGETMVWGRMFDAMGEGVLSAEEDWYPDPVGLKPFVLNEAAEVCLLEASAVE